MTTAVHAPLADTRPVDGGAPARRAVVRWAWRLFRREWRQQLLILALIVVAVAATIVGSAVATNTPPREQLRFRHRSGLRDLLERERAREERDRGPRASIRPRRGDRERDDVDPRIDQHVPAPRPGSARTVQRPDARARLRAVPGGRRRGRRDERRGLGVPPEGRGHLAPRRRRAPGRRRRREPPEPPRRVRARRTGAGEVADAGHGAVRRTGCAAGLDQDRDGGADAGIGRPVEPAQPRDDLARGPRARDAAHRPRLDRRLHRAGAASAPIDRHARVDRRHRPPRPPRRAGERRGRRTGRCGRRLRARRSSSGSPTGRASSRARTTSSGCSPCLGSSSPRRWCSRSSRRTSPRPDRRARSPGCRSSPRSRVARPRPARSTARRSPASSSSSRPSSSSATREARTAATGAAERQSWCSGSCSSSPGSSCSHRSSSRSPRGWPGARRSRPDWRCATSPVTEPARARRSRRSASGSSSRSSSCSPPPPATATSSTTRGRTLPRTSSALHANTPPPAGSTVIGPNGQQPGPTRLVDLDNCDAAAAGSARRSDREGPRRAAHRAREPRCRSRGDPRRSELERSDLRRDPAVAAGVRDQGVRDRLRTPTSSARGPASPGFPVSPSPTDRRPRAGPGSGAPSRCSAATDCLANPVIQEVGALPSGTSAPNTVITEHAMRQFHIQATTNDWLVQGSQPFSASQISNAELAASTTQLSVESKNDQPSSSAVITWATIFGIVIALGVLGMSVGLVRSETAGRSADARRHRGEQLHPPHADGRHGGRPRLPRRAARHRRGIHRAHRLASRQLAEWRHRLARERPGRVTFSSFSSPCQPSRPSSAGCLPAANRRRWPTSRSSEP